MLLCLFMNTEATGLDSPEFIQGDSLTQASIIINGKNNRIVSLRGAKGDEAISKELFELAMRL